MLLCLPPIVAIALQIKPDRAYFYLTIIAFILVLNWIHSFVSEIVIASRYKFWGFGICKEGYIGHEYTKISGILGIKLTGCLY